MTITPHRGFSLQQWLDYWSSIHVTAIDLGLERIRPVAEQLGVLSPQAHVVTVAGTNGKGSTTSTIASIYQAAGKQVGLYQSPHIERFNERIRLNGQEVDDQTLIHSFEQVEQARQATGLSLSFFEATTLAAFVIFNRFLCDVWVLEIGLGGRLDAVNLIDPDVAVITNIGLDHTDWLGDDLEKIAFEKAGIMRAGIPVVYADSALGEPVPQAIVDRADVLACQLVLAGRDYHYRVAADGRTFCYASPACTFTLDYPQLALVNVCAAVSAVLLSQMDISQQAIATGVQSAYIAGRFERRQIQQRTVVLDVAHNVHGVQFLKQQLVTSPQLMTENTRVHVVFSMLADKDIQGVVSELATVADHWYIAPLLLAERAASLLQLSTALAGQQTTTYNNIAQAFSTAMQQSQQQDIILVCGSFHTLEAVWESLIHVDEQ